jgi:hypothetical protein
MHAMSTPEGKPMAATRGVFARLTDLLARPKPRADVRRARFVFAIPVKPRRETTQWDVVSANLARTIRSVQGATDGNFQVFICGHEHPCPDLDDSRITFVRAQFEYGAESEQGSQDKARKLVLLGNTLREQGYDEFYVMFLDADDLVHKGLVEHVLATDNRRSHLVSRGYVYDSVTGNMTLRESAFDQVCGSSFICWFKNSDLPRHDNDHRCFFREFAPHKGRADTASANNRAPDAVPFPSVVYWMNHAESLQRHRTGGAQRKPSRRGLLTMEDARETLARDFSVSLQARD